MDASVFGDATVERSLMFKRPARGSCHHANIISSCTDDHFDIKPTFSPKTTSKGPVVLETTLASHGRFPWGVSIVW